MKRFSYCNWEALMTASKIYIFFFFFGYAKFGDSQKLQLSSCFGDHLTAGYDTSLQSDLEVCIWKDWILLLYKFLDSVSHSHINRKKNLSFSTFSADKWWLSWITILCGLGYFNHTGCLSFFWAIWWVHSDIFLSWIMFPVDGCLFSISLFLLNKP